MVSSESPSRIHPIERRFRAMLNPSTTCGPFEVNVVAKGAAKPQPTETPGKPTRVRLGGDIQAPRLLNRVQPIYPTATKAAGIEGTVILHAIIGMAGHPLSLRVLNKQVD
jgi:outer membrane biosynthesis protein TonB